jgi:DNA-binding NtrC family response regulator
MKKRSRRKADLEATLAASDTPAFQLDEKRRLRFFNAGCERLTGWSAEDMLGLTCDYASASDPDSAATLANSLCPPPEVFEGRPTRVPVFLIDRQGSSHARLIDFLPLLDESGHTNAVLGVVIGIDQPTRQVVDSPAQQMHADLASLRQELRQRYGLQSFIARSSAMQRVCRQIELARASTAPLLLCGAEGTGKEHVARLVHLESERRAMSFVPLDCSRLSAIELKRTFRHLFEPEDGTSSALPMTQPGTLYLSHVESLPRDLQQRLVDEFAKPSPPVRLIVSTTGDFEAALADEIAQREFHHLVTSLKIELPLLVDRPEDVAPLAQHFLEEANRGSELQIGSFDNQVLTIFAEYTWPGQLTELAEVVGEASAACTATTVSLADLPFRMQAGLEAQAVGPGMTREIQPIEPLLQRIETEHITRALTACRYNKSKAAELLGMTRPRLYRRMQMLKIEDREATP